MATFILNDENKTNSYGFRVLNAGIDLERFNSNPVMLDDHWNSTRSVLGRWKNIRIEGSKLLADADFDMEDADAKRISGKVDRGFIKGCSMGLLFDIAKMVLEANGNYVLLECELMEGSICAIPSNANAVHLYHKSDGHLMDETELKLSLQHIDTTKIKTDTMKKIQLSIAALTVLGYTEAPNEDQAADLSARIEKLSNDLKNETTARKALQTQLETSAKEKAEQLVTLAVNEGRITAEAKEEFVSMAVSNYAMAEKVIAAIPAKKSLSSQIDNPDNGNVVKSEEDFMKMSVEAQLAWKNANPDAYKKLFG